MRPPNTWLPQTIGLIAAAVVSILSSVPPAHPYSWMHLIAASALLILITVGACGVAMFLTYVALPNYPEIARIIRRTCGTAAWFAPLMQLLRHDSIWASVVVAFLLWTILPVSVVATSQARKFAVSFFAAVLLQLGAAAELAGVSLISALALGSATVPILWRVRQERRLRAAFQPGWTIAAALLLTIVSLTHYLPFGGEGVYAKVPYSGKQSKNASMGLSSGGKYRGVILSPKPEHYTVLVPPIPMMGRDPFLLHEDSIGIPFYGVYWFFQAPDRAPNEDAYRVKGSPDDITFRSADLSPLKMEAHQSLGRLIDLSACSRIDVSIRNADGFNGSVALELILVNTTLIGRPSQSLGQVAVSGQKFETLRFKIPAAPMIQQFDELTIRFPRARYRAARSAKVAIDRFFLVPRR